MVLWPVSHGSAGNLDLRCVGQQFGSSIEGSSVSL